MAGREKPKRKALHRGLDDIINRDASLTTRLLGRVKPPSREPLDIPASDDVRKPEAEPEKTARPAEGIREAGSSASPARQSAAPRPTGKSETASSEDQRDAAQSTSLTEKRGTGDLLKVVEQPKPTPPRADRSTGRTVTQSTGSNVVPARSAVPSFEGFVERWGFVLRSGGRAGKLRICEVLYNNTYAVGRETFFTSYEKLAKLTNLEKKQCSINIRQLESLGFVERLNIFNTATKQGTEFKLHLEQLSLGERRAPRYHCYDEDLR